MNWRRNTTAAGDERLRAGVWVGMTGARPSRPPNSDRVAYAQADRRREPRWSCGSSRRLPPRRQSLRRGWRGGKSPGNRDHVQTDGADGSHRLELVQVMCPAAADSIMPMSSDRNEGNFGEATDVRARHEAAPSSPHVEQRAPQRAVIYFSSTHLFEDVRDRAPISAVGARRGSIMLKGTGGEGTGPADRRG